MTPLPIPAPNTPSSSTAPLLTPGSPYQLRDRQDWAVAQERQRHNEALYLLGEYAAFVLMWRIQDLEAGRVERCSVCYGTDVISEIYNQPTQDKCPNCFGTTFEGGYKAILIRPSLWDTNEEDYRTSARGEVIVQTSSVQSTADFRLRTGDYILRADGSRYQMRTMASNELRTGFAMPSAATAVVGYNYGTVSREDESTVAYLLPPTNAVLVSRLNPPFPDTPPDFTDLEVIRGPVLA